MEILFTFMRTHDAIQAEQLLLDAEFDVKVMSLPSSVRAGCGICLRLPPKQAERAGAALADGGILVESVWRREDGVYTQKGDGGFG